MADKEKLISPLVALEVLAAEVGLVLQIAALVTAVGGVVLVALGLPGKVTLAALVLINLGTIKLAVVLVAVAQSGRMLSITLAVAGPVALALFQRSLDQAYNAGAAARAVSTMSPAAAARRLVALVVVGLVGSSRR